MESFDGLTDEQVADEIATWAGRVAAGEARLLALIAEFDRREAWGGVGILSCAHWLSWRIGIGLTAAHERVRVARALTGLPLVAAMFGRGQLSWTQVRAITRVAGAADEQSYIDLARHSSGAQLERVVRGVRRARRPAEDAADPEAAAYAMRVRVRYDEDGTMVTTIRTSAEDGAVLRAALEAAREEIDSERRARRACGKVSSAEDGSAQAGGGVPAGSGLPRATLGEAMLRVAQAALGALAAGRPDAARRRRPQLAVQIDPLSGWARTHDGEFLPPGTVRGRAGGTLRRVTAADLTAADLGRAQREVSAELRRLLGVLDGERCRFPGCTRTRRLHGHHVVYWSAGGRTDLANLVLLCERHHTIVHAQGFQLLLGADRTLVVRTAGGAHVFHHPARPAQHAGWLDGSARIGPTTLPPYATDARIDLGYIVSVMLQQAA